MTIEKWLQTIVSPLPSKLSAQLEQFLSSCDRNVTDEVINRANIILEVIFPTGDAGEPCITAVLHNDNSMDSLWAGLKQMEALKLYFRVLESICTSEAQKLHTGNLTLLLTNERFHRCMLACSAELVSARLSTTSLLFPVVLERIGITAFDMSKMIESFIRYEKSLPRELRRYLNSLEELLLESMVWEKGSSLYNYLNVARPDLSAEINCLGLQQEPMPSLDAIAVDNHVSCVGLPYLPFSQKRKLLPGTDGDVISLKRVCSEYSNKLVDHKSLASPMKNCSPFLNDVKSKPPPPSPPLQSAFSSPKQPNSQSRGNTCTEAGISVLFNKMEKLAAVRINTMAERLNLSQQIRESVNCLFRKILFQATTLFFNRHIDQIILCCFYGVAKVRIKFESLKLSMIWKQKNREDYGVIEFYNDIFTPAVRPLLEEIGPAEASSRVPEANNNDHCPGSPQMSPFRCILDMSPKKISPSRNIYLSPRKPSKASNFSTLLGFDVLISHGTKTYYAYVGRSIHPYQSPTKDLNVINNCLNGSRKPRSMFNFNSVDARFVSDSVVARSLILQNENCASSSHVVASK
ncbi:hypothetical protein L1049_003063 [Liquidambar formosana]|uniref:Retinoblastoma-associated protein A-box domain-containing protein n=1 Tax=Liquidambar formosana TaxID=63359 RepID=A0AAP0R9G8_LIQFO